jgi:hypothetical protein
MKFKNFILPAIASLLPSMFVLAENIQQVHSLSAWRLMLLSVAISILLTYSISKAIVNLSSASIIASLLILAWGFAGWIKWAVAPIVILALFLFVKRFDLSKLYIWITVMASIPLLICLLDISIYSFKRDFITPMNNHAIQAGPDIYFIVLDSYTGSDVLRSRFGYDNSPFLNSLHEIGFKTDDCRSHGSRTLVSLSYILSGNDPGKNMDAIRHNILRADLESKGYQTLAFSTGFIWSEMLDANLFISPDYGITPTELETILLLQTPLSEIPVDLTNTIGIRYRARTNNLLVHLADAASMDGSQFVFAHIIQPHPPFAFHADGSSTNPSNFLNPNWLDDRSQPEYLVDEYNIGYSEQVRYISSAILPALQKIVKKSPESMIILTGDHGAWYSENEDVYSVLCATRNLRSIEARNAVIEIGDR